MIFVKIIVGYLYVDFIIAKTNIHTWYWIRCSNIMALQYALVLCLVSLSWMFYFCVRSLNILWRFDSLGLLFKKRVPRSNEKWFILSLILKNVVVTFKEIIYLLLEYCGDWIYDLVCWFLTYDEKAHVAEWLYKEDSYPSFIHQFNSIELSLLGFRC